jgi:hypothetical protein
VDKYQVKNEVEREMNCQDIKKRFGFFENIPLNQSKDKNYDKRPPLKS